MNWLDKIIGLFGKANNKTLIIVAVFIIGGMVVLGLFCPDSLRDLIGILTGK